MKKYWFAPALGALVPFALLPFARLACAQSGVTLYGFIDTGVVSASNVFNKSTGRSGSVVQLGDGISWGTSRFGMTGSEDLGGGMSAIFKLEAGFDTPNGQLAGTGLFNRGSYVGLHGDFGTLTLGRQWNLSDDNMVGSFFRGGYNLSVFRLTGFDEISDLVDNAVKYKSPNWAGLQGSALYSLGGVPGRFAANRVFEVAATYTNGPLNLGGVYHDRNDATAPFSSRLWELGANYKFAPVTIRVGYASTTYPGTAGPSLHAALGNVGADFSATSSLTLSGDAIYRKQSGVSASATMFRLTADYSLSKRTGLFTNVGYLKNRGTSAESFYGDGQAGQSQTVVNIGMRHAF